MSEKPVFTMVETDRGTGRTTVIALNAITRALHQKGTWIKAVDHWSTLPDKNFGPSRNLCRTIRRMVTALKLEDVEVEIRNDRTPGNDWFYVAVRSSFKVN